MRHGSLNSLHLISSKFNPKPTPPNPSTLAARREVCSGGATRGIFLRPPRQLCRACLQNLGGFCKCVNPGGVYQSSQNPLWGAPPEVEQITPKAKPPDPRPSLPGAKFAAGALPGGFLFDRRGYYVGLGDTYPAPEEQAPGTASGGEIKWL